MSDSAAFVIPSVRSQFGPLDRLARRVVMRQLAGLRRGEIHLQDSPQTSSLGTASMGTAADLQATLQVHQPQFFRRAMLGGSLSVAESYLRGDWDCADLTSLFRIFVRNRDAANRFDAGLARLAGQAHRLFHWWHANTRRGSRQNIAAHYDLGNDFYRLWLDETMAYSCGIFKASATSLHDASLEKFDRVCRVLDLQPCDHLLEIGTGWGGFAIHAANHYHCRVTTTTISGEQHAAACQRVQSAGLSERVTLLQQDYRDLRGSYDKLASIEMIEAVGHKYLDQYFRQCGQLLKPDGSLVLQAIVMPERGHDRYLKGVDFIQRYIFPGGCLPSLGSILSSVGRTTDLRLVRADDFAPHYAETLRRWRQAFTARLPEVRTLGFPEQFIRLWNYYLCYCEAAFEERYIGLLQIQFDKPDCRRDAMQFAPVNTTARLATAAAGSPRILSINRQ